MKKLGLVYCLVCIMAIGTISALVGCEAEVNTPGTNTETEETFSVTIDPAMTNGTVTTSPKSGKRSTTIRVTVKPNDGYQLKAGSLKYNNQLITTQNVTGTGYTFKMPGRDVIIYAQFEEKPEGQGQGEEPGLDPERPGLGAPKPDYSQYKEEIDAIIAQMTLDEKIGQMAQVVREQLTHTSSGPGAEVKQYFLGSVLSGGGSGPGAGTSSGNTANTSVTQWYNYINGILRASMENPAKGPMADKDNPVTGGKGYGIPFVYGIDAVHGNANAMTNPTVFPHNIGMGAIAVGNLEAGRKAAYDAGKVTATEMYAAGQRFNFNPVLGVGENMSWGRMYESYSSSSHPEIAAALGTAYIQGLQSSGKVGGCGKHYGFEGQASGSTPTKGNATVSLTSDADLLKILPYKDAIQKGGLLSIMTFYGQVNNTKPVRYKALLDILKKPVDEGGYGFEGFIITDWSDMGTSNSEISSSINAGVDMAMLASSRSEWTGFISNLKTLVNNNTVPLSRINDAVYRILLFKKVFGILDDPLVPSGLGVNGLAAQEAHRQVSRDIAAQTLVLLKNDNDVVGKLAAGEYKNILVTGTGATNLGYQCGGWTREWQGFTSATLTGFTGVNIYDGIRNAATNRFTGMDVRNNSNGAVISGFSPDVIIAVASETPYSEGSGDTSIPSIGSGKGVSADTTMLTNAYAQNKPVILVIISGRPLRLGNATSGDNQTQYKTKSAGIVAAWLPGSQAGDAIADVLLGSKEFVGRTPYPWSESGGNSGAVNFPYGYGLRKGQDTATTGGFDLGKLENAL